VQLAHAAAAAVAAADDDDDADDDNAAALQTTHIEPQLVQCVASRILNLWLHSSNPCAKQCDGILVHSIVPSLPGSS